MNSLAVVGVPITRAVFYQDIRPYHCLFSPIGGTAGSSPPLWRRRPNLQRLSLCLIVRYYSFLGLIMWNGPPVTFLFVYLFHLEMPGDRQATINYKQVALFSRFSMFCWNMEEKGRLLLVSIFREIFKLNRQRVFYIFLIKNKSVNVQLDPKCDSYLEG